MTRTMASKIKGQMYSKQNVEEISKSSTAVPPPLPEFPNILITVGTTKYDEFITWAQSPKTLQYFKNWKTKHVKIQYGSSTLVSPGFLTPDADDTIVYEFYDFKPSLGPDIQWSDLVISHAGVGTVIDVLDAGKPLFLIPNQSLMDNHQIELGESLYEQGHVLYSSSLEGSYEIMDRIQREHWIPLAFPKKNPEPFLQCLSQLMNLS